MSTRLKKLFSRKYRPRLYSVTTGCALKNRLTEWARLPQKEYRQTQFC